MASDAQVAFFVAGKPAPGGSKRVGLVMRNGPGGGKVPAVDPRTKLPRTFVTDMSGAAGRAWRQDVKAAAQTAMAGRPPTGAAVSLRVVFGMPRPKGHYRTGRHAEQLRPGAPMSPTTKPDATKLLRALEDALTGVVWRDDAQVVEITVVKSYAPVDGWPGADVTAVWS